MSAPDLHPEELLDKAAQGTLTDAERAHLDQHLAACDVCRFEQRARRDFREAAALEVNVDSLVASALSGLPSAAPALPPGSSAKSGARVLAAAVVLFVSMASFAAVATATGVLPRLLAVFTGEKVAPEPVALPPWAARRPTGAEARPTPPGPEVEPVPAAPQASPQAAPPAAALLPAPVIAVPVPAARPRTVARADERAKPVLPEVLVPDAGELFARANQARVQGNRAGAVKLYGELLEQFPGADEARVSQAALGRLLLDSGDPAAALVQLDAYLAGGDATLREEVLAARATALSRLNRPRDEAQAWKAILDDYPDSVHAARARARLSELEGR